MVIGWLAANARARSDDGFSSISRTEDSLGNYQFGYDITDWDTNRKRWEVADAYNNRKGGYSITDVDGKVRHLEYVADKSGFRAVVRTNEPGTAPGYHGDALYLRKGVKEIITSSQPALQLTGHVIKQKKLATVHALASAAPVPVAVDKPIIYQQPSLYDAVQPKPIVQPINVAKTVVGQLPLVRPAFQVYQTFQPMVHVAPKSIQLQKQIVQPFVQSVVHYKPLVYQQPIMRLVPVPKTVVYQQSLVQPAPKVNIETYQHVESLSTARQPKLIVPVSDVLAGPVMEPVVQKAAVAQRVTLKEKKIIVTPPPAYTGPRRRPQKLIEDPSQSYETPELPKLTPKRVPGYTPALEDFEDDYDSITAAPPLHRDRVTYSPDQRVLAISKFTPLYIKPGGITRKSGSFPPLAGPPSRRARA
ncbi:proline-rich extensin-like protein EPR1 [Varroa destructor]|uniref:Cuticle protein n=1 Tax=Varroa destructor TaxID=109461 RepID=A0A7M7L7V6_VARDE|nr:proline-rich extensin-like protein EPR1 [Varroa destructor]